MTMKIERVEISAITPDPNNPRDDFGDIKALAESFALNTERPGEPLNPPVVVADGNVYRIIDGERRWRAMKMAGTKECSVAVCDGMDEADELVSMLATDDKRRLTDIERSKGVQQMLVLGVPVEKIDKAARVGRGTAAKVATAMAKVDSKAETMSIDHLLAIEEFADDEEAVKDLTDAGESDWSRIAFNIRKSREMAKEALALREMIAKSPIRIVDDRTDSDRFLGSIYATTDVAEFVEANPGEELIAVDRCTDYMSYFSVYSVCSGEAIDPKEEERRQEVDETLHALEEAEKRHFEFFLEARKEPGEYPHLIGFLKECLLSYNGSRRAEKELIEFEAESGHAVDESMSDMDIVLGWRWSFCDIALESFAEDIVAGKAEYQSREDRMRKYLEMWDAMCDDGYKFSDDESDVNNDVHELVYGGDDDEA